MEPEECDIHTGATITELEDEEPQGKQWQQHVANFHVLPCTGNFS